ncbi:hypothetical protein PGB28_01625 [Primorskyibacter aestuariivivens]|uniref:hypothetical protein n=1 Tax=Primorskyibacter aestuariivivens TaxID=1888912 RepID=UPI002301A9A2|nr:hypothetical protein [Primorskyibacter aestuariivivens]MDA7427141.1 hypothetical protein [Primorskyibacter aestuariivivens]
MPQGTKIATCCYCGTRAALVLRGDKRHELACSSCGAPLHDMKLMPSENIDPAAHRSKPAKGKKAKGGRATPNPLWERQKPEITRKRKKPKKKKSRFGNFLSDAFEDAFDVIEDIFD